MPAKKQSDCQSDRQSGGRATRRRKAAEVNAALDRAEEICRRKGLRFTPMRRRVLSLVLRSAKPAKAYELLERLGDAAAGPPVVYRALDFLLEAGVVHRVKGLNAYLGCGHPLEHDSCQLLVCSECGDVRECCGGALESAVRAAAGRNGFEPDHDVIEIRGRCAACRGAGE